jgi:hypothetical protein
MISPKGETYIDQERELEEWNWFNEWRKRLGRGR